MYICIFEDEFYRKLLPLVYFRPVYDLICGMTSLEEKIYRAYPNRKIILNVRSYLAEVVREKYPDVGVNDIPGSAHEVLFVNGRLLMSKREQELIGSRYPGKDLVFTKNGIVVAAWISGENLERMSRRTDSGKRFYEDCLDAPGVFESLEKRELTEATLIEYPWELIKYNGAQIISDFEFVTGGEPRVLGKVYESAHLLNLPQIHIAEGSNIKPGVVLDAERGPIYVSRNVRIMPNAVIEGPAFIGENTLVKISGKIYENTTIGEMCKVGGEVEESIIHGYSNKQHEGFIGHSYLGEWVNLGADSNNSDLKNDYGSVKVYNDGKLVDTGMQFVGLIMGDHSKCGINSMFNTGAVVGANCNLFGTGVPPNYLPPFTWGGAAEGFKTYRIGKAVEVARRVMKRRNLDLSSSMEQLLRKVFEMTIEDRVTNGIRDGND